jgi:hypothetical protein
MTEAIGVLGRTPGRVTAFDGSMGMLAVALGSLIVIQLWFGLIGTSLWIDETGTWWIIKDGPGQAIHRAITWSAQSLRGRFGARCEAASVGGNFGFVVISRFACTGTHSAYD